MACRVKAQGLKIGPYTLLGAAPAEKAMEGSARIGRPRRPTHIRELIGAETKELKLKGTRKSLVVALL